MNQFEYNLNVSAEKVCESDCCFCEGCSTESSSSDTSFVVKQLEKLKRQGVNLNRMTAADLLIHLKKVEEDENRVLAEMERQAAVAEAGYRLRRAVEHLDTAAYILKGLTEMDRDVLSEAFGCSYSGSWFTQHHLSVYATALSLKASLEKKSDDPVDDHKRRAQEDAEIAKIQEQIQKDYERKQQSATTDRAPSARAEQTKSGVHEGVLKNALVDCINQIVEGKPVDSKALEALGQLFEEAQEKLPEPLPTNYDPDDQFTRLARRVTASSESTIAKVLDYLCHPVVTDGPLQHQARLFTQRLLTELAFNAKLEQFTEQLMRQFEADPERTQRVLGMPPAESNDLIGAGVAFSHHKGKSDPERTQRVLGMPPAESNDLIGAGVAFSHHKGKSDPERTQRVLGMPPAESNDLIGAGVAFSHHKGKSDPERTQRVLGMPPAESNDLIGAGVAFSHHKGKSDPERTQRVLGMPPAESNDLIGAGVAFSHHKGKADRGQAEVKSGSASQAAKAKTARTRATKKKQTRTTTKKSAK